MTPAEFEALARHTVFLIVVLTQKPEWLPVQRIYIRADAQELPVDQVSTWKTAVDSGSNTAKVYGPHREDGFYLVPGGAMLRKGQIVMDLSANQAGWLMMELPSNVASADARRFPSPGFPVPQSLR